MLASAALILLLGATPSAATPSAATPSAATPPIVSMVWLQAHLNDPAVVVIDGSTSRTRRSASPTCGPTGNGRRA